VSLVELPGLEDVGEPGFVAFHADDFVHDAAVYEPHLHGALVGNHIHVAQPEALIGGAVGSVWRIPASVGHPVRSTI
jgi:hypothetical protein